MITSCSRLTCAFFVVLLRLREALQRPTKVRNAKVERDLFVLARVRLAQNVPDFTGHAAALAFFSFAVSIVLTQ